MHLPRIAQDLISNTPVCVVFCLSATTSTFRLQLYPHLCVMSPQRFGPSWLSSRNVWTSRQRCESSCCRTYKTSSERRQRSRQNIPGTWRNWQNASWQRLVAPRTTSSTSKEILIYLFIYDVDWVDSLGCRFFRIVGCHLLDLIMSISYCCYELKKSVSLTGFL